MMNFLKNRESKTIIKQERVNKRLITSLDYGALVGALGYEKSQKVAANQKNANHLEDNIEKLLTKRLKFF